MFTYKFKTKLNTSKILGVRVANILKKKLGKNYLKKIKFPKKLTFIEPHPFVK